MRTDLRGRIWDVELQTERLRFLPLGESSDSDEVLPVFNSNPEWIAASNDYAGQGEWDRSDVEMHLWKESMRENSVAFLLRSLETEELIGLGGFLEPHPEREIPMIGLLLIHRSWQRRGLGTEAVEAMMEYLGDGDWDRVSVTVLEACPGVGEFWSRLGFEVVEQTHDQDKRAVWVMEAQLDDLSLV
jgi:RimJ/RimL family protein N-acetyltransferase